MDVKGLMFGNLGQSHSAPGKVDYTDLLKVLRTAIVAGIAAFLGVVATQLPGLDFVKDSQVDNMIITVFLIPLTELARRWAANYQG